ncbi:hypothetical protein BGZ76_003122 [Entomortierella beljakovae]|nr:hypothetical protein BGZ76_003122 [Entomortierella beljakovae]
MLELNIITAKSTALLYQNSNSLISLTRNQTVHQPERYVGERAKLFTAISSLVKLRELSLDALEVSPDEGQAFLMSCQRLTILRLKKFNWNLPDLSLYEFPAIEQVTFFNNKMLAMDELEFVTRCPNVRFFRWKTYRCLEKDQYLQVQTLLSSRLKCLRTLAIQSSALKDEDIGTIISSLPSLVNLHAKSTRFGRYATRAIVKSKPGIQELDISDCESTTPRMIHKLLSTCCDLETFGGNVYDMRDLATGPWVCNRLKMLRISIMTSSTTPVEKSQETIQMYDQLSQLTELRELSIGEAMSTRDSYSWIDLTLSGGFESTSTEAPNVPFFKKRTQSKNVRKRDHSDDEDESSKTSSLDTSSLSSISKKRIAKRVPQTSGSDILQSSSLSSANRLSSKEDADRSVGVSYKATLDANVRIDDATRTQEIDTAHDRDAQSVIDRHMRAVENGLEDTDTYKGMAAYKSHVQKSETTNSKIRIGPMRASANIRVTNRFDYQPDICKDYKETGFCGYGDSCIYMHDRGDYKAGWQLDQEWEAEQRAKKLALIEGLDEDSDSSSDDDDVPFACLICREDFKNPIVTKCNHYFCEKCALQRYRKSPKCAACQAPTGGLFNTVSKDFLKKVAERKAKIEDAARRRAEDESANGGGADIQNETTGSGEDTGMVEDLSVVGMGGAPNLPPTGDGSDDSDDDDSDSD